MALKAASILTICASIFLGMTANAGISHASASSGSIAVTVKTPRNDGVAHLPAVNGYTEFTVTAVNQGESRKIIVKPGTGTYPVPVMLTVCQTNAAGNCLKPFTSSITVNFFYGKTLTFKVGVRGQNYLPRMAADRAYLYFYAAGALVAEPSAALDDGSKFSAATGVPGIYTVTFDPRANSSYNLSGEGLYILSPNGDGYMLTHSGILIHQSPFNFSHNSFYTADLLWPYTNNIQQYSSNSDAAFFELTAAAVPEHWIAAKYDLTGGQVNGFEYGTLFATYQKDLYERGSSQALIQGNWKIRFAAGGPVVGTLSIDKSGLVTQANVKNCQLPTGTGKYTFGNVTLVDPRFNAYKVAFGSDVILTDVPLCLDLINSSGVAATFDTKATNDTLRILIHGESDGYSWILTRN